MSRRGISFKPSAHIRDEFEPSTLVTLLAFPGRAPLPYHRKSYKK